MLSQNDLQQIKTVLHEEITVELEPVKQDTDLLKKGQKSIKRQLTIIKRDVKFISGNYDTRITENARNLEKLKEEVKTLKQN